MLSCASFHSPSDLLSMIISKSFHVAANGIISFFLWLSSIPLIQPVHSEDQPWDFFGRKVMTNLDSIFRNRDITLSTKVRLVKPMVFPVVMYECESWTVKKAER